MNLKKIFYFLFILCFIEIHAAEKPFIINIYRDKYKAANKNWSACQDERGIMYFGNDKGLLEFDGMVWKLHPSINGSYIKGIGIESHEVIYTGGFEDIGRWNRDVSGNLKYISFKKLLPKGMLHNETIWRVCVDNKNKKVYYQSFGHIYIFNGTSVRQLGLKNGLLFLHQVGDEYWVQEIYGSLYRLTNDKLQRIEGSDIFKGKLARVILAHGNGQCLVGTSSGEIYRYAGGRFTLWNKAFSEVLRDKELNSAVGVPKRGTYYWGTLLDGVYETDANGNVLAHYSSKNSLQNNTILALCKDNLDNVWVGMDRGLAYIRYTKGLSYYNSFSQDIGAVYCATYWNNYLLIGTNQGVYYIPQKSLFSSDYFSSLKFMKGTQGQVWSFSAVDGRLFCGHNMSILEIGKDMNASAPYPLHTGVFRITKLPVKDRNLLFVVTYNKPAIVDMDTRKVWEVSGISKSVINAEVDHLNNIWMETVGQGIYKCRLTDDYKSYHYLFYYGTEKDKSLPEKLSLFKVGGRIVFLGDNTFWVYDENRDQIVPENKLNKCFAQVSDLKRLVHINDDQSWAITSSSIYRLMYDGYIARILEAYNVDNDNLSLVNADENISVLNDSVSLVCLDAGFILHNLHEKSAGVKLNAPLIESVKISISGGKERYLASGEDAEIPYNYNNVTFNFTESHSFTSNLSVQYILEGMGNEWSEPSTSGSVFYARLPKGSYTFKLRTIDGLGNESEETVYRFEILSPWYQTYWAYLLYVLITGSVLYLVWMLILRRYRNLHLQKVRAREARYLRRMNENLLNKIEEKDAELFTQTSFIIKKNELILSLKNIADDFYAKSAQKSLLPFIQKINALLANNMDTEDDWNMFLIRFEEKHKNFFKKLKMLYPQLTNNDLRLCACLKLGLESKDIASLMNISVRAVENNRYRLRKKLDLKPTQNLNDCFMEID